MAVILTRPWIFGGAVAGTFLLLAGMATQQPARAAEEPSASKRFRVMGDGTVHDQATGLVWLQQADALGTKGWPEAVAACTSLGAGGVESLQNGSKAGEWRLPTAHELLTLTKAGLSGGSLPEDHPFLGLTTKRKGRIFWTQTEGFHDSSKAFRVSFQGKGEVATAGKQEIKLGVARQGTQHASTRARGPDTGFNGYFCEINAIRAATCGN